MLPVLIHVGNEQDQARFVVDEILNRQENGAELKEQATLFRSSNHSAQLELELNKRGIPFKKYGGSKFLEAAHIKDVLSVLAWWRT